MYNKILDTITSIDFQFWTMAASLLLLLIFSYVVFGEIWWRKWKKLESVAQSLEFLWVICECITNGVRLFKHPAHDYLINSLAEFFFFFLSSIFFAVCYFYADVVSSFEKKNLYLYKHLTHTIKNWILFYIMWESDFRWSRMPYLLLYLFDIDDIHFFFVIEDWMRKIKTEWIIS